MKSTACERCRHTIDNNDDFDIGPVDLSKICGDCFYNGSAKTKLECGCGEPSYDSQANSDDDYCSDGCDDDVDHSESSEQ